MNIYKITFLKLLFKNQFFQISDREEFFKLLKRFWKILSILHIKIIE